MFGEAHPFRQLKVRSCEKLVDGEQGGNPTSDLPSFASSRRQGRSTPTTFRKSNGSADEFMCC